MIVAMVTRANTGHKSDVFYVTVPWGGYTNFHAVMYHAQSCQCYKKNHTISESKVGVNICGLEN